MPQSDDQSFNSIEGIQSIHQDPRDAAVLLHSTEIQLAKDLEKQVAQLQQTIQRMKAKEAKNTQRHQRELQALEEQVKEEATSRALIERKIHEEREKLKDELNEKDKQLLTQFQINEALEAESTKMAESISKLQKQLSAKTSKCEDLENAIKSRQDSFQKQKSELQSLNDQLRDQVKSHQQKEEESQERIRLLEEMVENDRKEVERMFDEAEKTRNELAVMQEKCRNSESRLSERNFPKQPEIDNFNSQPSEVATIGFKQRTNLNSNSKITTRNAKPEIDIDDEEGQIQQLPQSKPNAKPLIEISSGDSSREDPIEEHRQEVSRPNIKPSIQASNIKSSQKGQMISVNGDDSILDQQFPKNLKPVISKSSQSYRSHLKSGEDGEQQISEGERLIMQSSGQRFKPNKKPIFDSYSPKNSKVQEVQQSDFGKKANVWEPAQILPQQVEISIEDVKELLEFYMDKLPDSHSRKTACSLIKSSLAACSQ